MAPAALQGRARVKIVCQVTPLVLKIRDVTNWSRPSNLLRQTVPPVWSHCWSRPGQEIARREPGVRRSGQPVRRTVRLETVDLIRETKTIKVRNAPLRSVRLVQLDRVMMKKMTREIVPPAVPTLEILSACRRVMMATPSQTLRKAGRTALLAQMTRVVSPGSLCARPAVPQTLPELEIRAQSAREIPQRPCVSLPLPLPLSLSLASRESGTIQLSHRSQLRQQEVLQCESEMVLHQAKHPELPGNRSQLSTT